MSDLSSLSSRFSEEVDPEHALRIQQQRYAQRVQQRLREAREVSAVVEDIYRTSWTEFYDREPGQSAQLIRSLEVASPHAPLPWEDLFDEDADADDMDLESAVPEVKLDLWSPDTRQHHQLLVEDSLELPGLSSYAYPKYEACTPSLESIHRDSDPRILHFIPYADEAGFKTKLYVSKHMQLAWQTEWFDVDFKLIAADAILRLADLELDSEKVEQFKPRFLPSPAGGFMKFLRKRDLPHWTSELLRQHQSSATPPTSRLSAQVNHLVVNFCSSLLCNKAKCMAHDVVSPPVVFAPPTLSNEEMHAKGRVKCGDDCFLQFGYAPLLAEPSMDPDICDLLKQFPKQRPCELAVLARTTCYNVFHHRCHIFPDGQPPALEAEGDLHASQSLGFCVHPGPCTGLDSDCPCVKHKRMCQRRCRCAKDCSLRHKGCQRKSDKPCACLDLPVITECDPELCRKRKKQGKSKVQRKHQCANMRSQVNKVPHLSVKIGSWGLGTFAETRIPKGAFIGEYISEIIPNPENEEGGEGVDQAQSVISIFRGLNYLFEHPDDHYTLDAATVGNAIRYINDPLAEAKANVQATNTYVDGQAKINFFATRAIHPGQELMLLYGAGYWEKRET